VFAFNVNIWTDPNIQRILYKETNENDDTPDGLTQYELHAAFRYLIAIANMEIK
jgi:hypothetical protein